jgi:hypothetical protein
MAKKTTLDDIAKVLAEHGKEIRDLPASIAHVVKHMATKDDIVLQTLRENVEAAVDVQSVAGKGMRVTISFMHKAPVNKPN